MATLQIRKKTASVWEHVPSDGNAYIVSKLYCKTNGDFFRVVEQGGRQRAEYHYSQITVWDDSQGGGQESFANARALMLRLEALEYIGFFFDGGGGGIGFQPVIISPENGQIIVYQDGQWINTYAPLSDKIIQRGTITINDDEIELGLGFIWRLMGIVYSNLSVFTQSILPATENYFRTDIIVGTSSNSFLYIQGEESLTNPVRPNEPDNTIFICSINVFGDIITGVTPTEPFDMLSLPEIMTMDNNAYAWINLNGIDYRIELSNLLPKTQNLFDVLTTGNPLVSNANDRPVNTILLNDDNEFHLNNGTESSLGFLLTCSLLENDGLILVYPEASEIYSEFDVTAEYKILNDSNFNVLISPATDGVDTPVSLIGGNASIPKNSIALIKFLSESGGYTASVTFQPYGDRPVYKLTDTDTVADITWGSKYFTTELLTDNLILDLPDLEDYDNEIEIKILNNNPLYTVNFGSTLANVSGSVTDIPFNTVGIAKFSKEYLTWYITYQSSGGSSNFSQVLVSGSYGGSNSPVIDAGDGQRYKFSDGNPGEGGDIVAGIGADGSSLFLETDEAGVLVEKIRFEQPVSGSSVLMAPETTVTETIATREYVDNNFVNSVTGDGVDNTDPHNPVLSFPTPSEIGIEFTDTLDGFEIGTPDHKLTIIGDIEIEGSGALEHEMPLTSGRLTNEAYVDSKVNKFKNSITEYSNTGNTTENIVHSVDVNVGDFLSGDKINFELALYKIGTAGTGTLKCYANTTTSLSGATQLFGLQLSAANLTGRIRRRMPLKTISTQRIFNPTNLLGGNDFGVSNSLTTLNVDYSVSQKIFFTLQNGNSADTTVLEDIVIDIIR